MIDLGMVLLEPRFSDQKIDVSKYNGQTGSFLNPFNHTVFEWLSHLEVEMEKVQVESWYRGKSYKDVLISDCLQVLNVIDFDKGEIEEGSLGTIFELHGLHPRMKHHELFAGVDLAEMLPKIYGESVASFFLAIARKVGGPDATQLLARYHRILWLPLYFPETILNFFESGIEELKELEFWSPRNGGVSGMLTYFRSFLLDRGMIEKQTPQTFTIEPRELRRQKNLEIVFRDIREPSGTMRKTIRLGLVVYEKTNSYVKKVTHNVDPMYKWFRLSQSLSASSAVVVELGYVAENEKDSELICAAEQALKHLSIKAQSPPLVFRTEFSFPVGITVKDNMKNQNSPILNEYVTDLETRSFNNQVLLGLRAANDIKQFGATL
jgi:hypothetical protein